MLSPWGYWPMQWKQAGKLSLIALIVGSGPGCMKSTASQNFGVPYPPAWHARMAQQIDPGDKIQSPAITPQDGTALTMTAYDDVQLAAWPAKPIEQTDQPDTAIWLSHPSLPVPSYVEITRLDNGRTVLARVATRASGSRPVILALSEGLARHLSLGASGQAAFRVRRVNPPEPDRVALRQGQAAAERVDTPEFLLAVLRKQASNLPDIRSAEVRAAAARVTAPPAIAPTRVETGNPQKFTGWQSAGPEQNLPVSGPRRGGYDPSLNAPPETAWFVQIAALSNGQNAQALARQIGGRIRLQQGLYRVLSGPYATLAQARAALGPLAAKGYPEARITR